MAQKSLGFFLSGSSFFVLDAKVVSVWRSFNHPLNRTPKTLAAWRQQAIPPESLAMSYPVRLVLIRGGAISFYLMEQPSGSY